MAIALGVRTLYLENFALKTCIHDAGFVFFFSSRRRHTRFDCDWSSDVCSSDLAPTTTRARHVSRFPSPPPRATTPATARPSQRRSCTLVLSRTTAPARAAARSRMGSNVARGRAKLYGPAGRPHIPAPPRRAPLLPSPAPPPSCHDAGHRAPVPEEVLHPRALTDNGPRARGCAQQDGVERGAGQGKAVRAGEAPAHHRATRGDHLHPVHLGVGRALHRLQHTVEPPEDRRGGGAEILRAGFVAGEAGAIEQQHPRAAAGKQQGGSRTGRPGAHDDRVPAIAHTIRTPSATTTAPHSVAARFTASLSSHRKPLMRRTGWWHTVFPRSNRAPHSGHSCLPCTVAPSSESATIPATPAPAISAADPGAAPWGRKASASRAIITAPAAPPSEPKTVIPPDVPRGTCRPLVMSRGAKGEKAPISVAQVSAAAAASAPAAIGHALNSAATAATPPFASTCRAVRRGARRSASCVRRLPERKKTRSNTRPRHETPHVTAPPTASAATTPSGVSHLTRRTARAGSGASARGARPGPGSGRAGNRGTASRSRSAHRREGTR